MFAEPVEPWRGWSMFEEGAKGDGGTLEVDTGVSTRGVLLP